MGGGGRGGGGVSIFIISKNGKKCKIGRKCHR